MKWPHAVCVHWAKRPFHWASLRLSVCLSFRRVPVFYDFYVAIRVLAVSVLIKV